MDNVETIKASAVNVSGEVVVIDAQGTERPLVSGESLAAGDMVIVRAEGSAELDLGKSETETVPADTAAVLEVDPNTGEIVLVLHSVGSEGLDVTDVQQAILAGQDPTEILEETAAGNTPPDSCWFFCVSIGRPYR